MALRTEEVNLIVAPKSNVTRFVKELRRRPGLEADKTPSALFTTSTPPSSGTTTSSRLIRRRSGSGHVAIRQGALQLVRSPRPGCQLNIVQILSIAFVGRGPGGKARGRIKQQPQVSIERLLVLLDLDAAGALTEPEISVLASGKAESNEKGGFLARDPFADREDRDMIGQNT